jgi:PPK2 family polyphosphate:nucleotide phosphotransferase
MNNWRVTAKKKFKLGDWDPGETDGWDIDKDDAPAKLAELQQELSNLQELLYAEHRHRLLVVLQGMDTSGKDGTIRHVFKGVNPQGVRVISFKKPTERELDHDYLWRVHQHTPGKGEIVIFNRSHYEDVVVTRVLGLIDKPSWQQRYAHINEFERMLSEEGTTILKFFLHISAKEQWERIRMRLDDPGKRWKFHPDDVKARGQWPAYARAYEEAIGATSTRWAPWHIIPANKKWFRNLAVSSVIVTALKQFKMSYPKPESLPP